MNRIPVFVVALLLVACFSLPAFAHTAQQQDSATVTFELTINGDITPDDVFGAIVREAPPSGAIIEIIDICGVPGTPACQGNGTVYTGTLDVPLGTVLDVTFARGTEIFLRQQVTAASDTTITTAYPGDTAAPSPSPSGQPGASPLPAPALPGTGATDSYILLLGAACLLLSVGGIGCFARARR